jgi:hypothetical protein
VFGGRAAPWQTSRAAAARLWTLWTLGLGKPPCDYFPGAQGGLNGSQQTSESRLPAQKRSEHQCGRRCVRAEGFEPPRSFEHRHLKPGCLPVPPRPQAPMSVPLRWPPNLSVTRPTVDSSRWRKERAIAIGGGVRGRPESICSGIKRLCDRASDRNTSTDCLRLAQEVTNPREMQERVSRLRS